MNNYKLKIQYDGTDFSGWQIQKNANSVQQEIRDAIEILVKEKVNLIGSGRTDSGVHALGQVANFRTEQCLDKMRFQRSLNGILPRSIFIESVNQEDERFNSRFSARKRSYIYLISLKRSPFYLNYSYYLPQAKDLKAEDLNRLSRPFLGIHDFTSFSKKNAEVRSKDCEIFDISWRPTGNFIVFYIEANRFLYSMVRTLGGSILRSALYGRDQDYLINIAQQKDRLKADKALPSKGLFLYKVKYQ